MLRNETEVMGAEDQIKSPENLSLSLFLWHQRTGQEQNVEHQFLYQQEVVHLRSQETPSISSSVEHLEL